MRAPVSFFDTTPIGRVLNRFTKDMDAVDLMLPRNVPQVLQFRVLCCADYDDGRIKDDVDDNASTENDDDDGNDAHKRSTIHCIPMHSFSDFIFQSWVFAFIAYPPTLVYAFV